MATVDADDDGVVVEANIPPELARSFAFFGEGSDLLVDLPADSWVALGQKDLGKLIEFYVDAYAGVAGGRDAIEGQFKAATGLDLQQDVLSWMGDFGIFVRGTSLASLDGALVIETTDEAASVRFLAALARIAKTQADNPGDRIGPLSAPGGGKGFTLVSADIPKPIHVFRRDGRVVFAYGDAAAKDAVEPGPQARRLARLHGRERLARRLRRLVLRADPADPRPGRLHRRRRRRRLAEGEAVPRAAERAGRRHLGRRRRPEVRRQADREVARVRVGA